MTAVESERERATERQADDVRPVEADRVDERRQAVGVTRYPEGLRWIR